MGESEKWKDVIGGGSVVVVFTSSPHPHPHPPLPNGFTSSTKNNFERVSFLTETENRHIHETNVSQEPAIHEHCHPPPLPPNLNVSTVFYVCLDVICVLYFVFVVNMSKKTLVNINNSTVIIQCPWQGGPPFHSFNI